jgi:IS5 family transposase
MASDSGQMIYRRRSRIETVNAILKGRGLDVIRVRSMAKVTCIVLLQVLGHNLWCAHRLRTATP